MSEELKPCPFCGKPAKWEKKFLIGGIARCSDYQCIGAFTHLSRSAASGEWNTRPAEEVLKAKVERMKAENDELRYIVEQFAKWTAEGGCVKANFPDFPCWWERNRIELKLDDYCDSEDEIEHKCWVEYYRWKFRQKNNAPDTEKGREDE